jgi:hypothetical protein
LNESVFDNLVDILKKHGLNELEYKDRDVNVRLFGAEFWYGLRSCLENSVKNVGAINAEKVISHCSYMDSV